MKKNYRSTLRNRLYVRLFQALFRRKLAEHGDPWTAFYDAILASSHAEIKNVPALKIWIRDYKGGNKGLRNRLETIEGMKEV